MATAKCSLPLFSAIVAVASGDPPVRLCGARGPHSDNAFLGTWATREFVLSNHGAVSEKLTQLGCTRTTELELRLGEPDELVVQARSRFLQDGHHDGLLFHLWNSEATVLIGG
jgi:hypothetical protein